VNYNLAGGEADHRTRVLACGAAIVLSYQEGPDALRQASLDEGKRTGNAILDTRPIEGSADRAANRNPQQTVN